MGYLGFGMRKEVYKRKPKKAFKKLKKHQAPPPSSSSSAGHDASNTYHAIRFKPAYQRGWFWVLAAIALSVSTYFYLDQTIFEEQRQLKSLVIFESQGIRDYYSSNKTKLDSIAQFIQSKNGKVASIERNQNRKLTLTIRSEDYHRQAKNRDLNNYYYALTSTYLQPEVIYGKLKYSLNDLHRVYEGYWTCGIELEKIRDLNTTFISHLETSYHELDDLLSKVAETNFSVHDSFYGITFEFERMKNFDRVDTYKFILSNHPDSLIGTYAKPPIKLAEGVYWSKD